MASLDMKKELKELYNASSKEAGFVDVPELNYIMIDGEGNPGTSQAFHDAVQALYSVSYKLKFTLKQSQLDYKVMPLQGLWWTDDMKDFSVLNKDIWKWTLMILQPEQVTEDLFRFAVTEVLSKKGLKDAAKLRLERYKEGFCAQIMHLGPYSAEAPTVQKLHEFTHNKGYALTGKHHEIYLGDPNKTAPEKLKTIIRQPVR